MKELETVVQDEKNKWILITGIFAGTGLCDHE